jgi:hypothetical protein
MARIRVVDPLQNRECSWGAVDGTWVVAQLCVCDAQIARHAPFSSAVPDLSGYDSRPVEALYGARVVA